MSATVSSLDEFESRALSMAMPKLYLSEESADFHFICESSDGQWERIPAHKLLLTTVSDVFQAMFNGSWIEKKEVEIVDASAEAFKEFLQFFYRSKVKLTMDNVAEVMNLGNKYEVEDCFNSCAKYLKYHLTVDNVFWGYVMAVHLQHDGLRRFCEIIIGLNTKAALASDDFLRCESKIVKRILLLDSLNCPEADIFKAMIKWVEVKSKQDDPPKEIVQGRCDDLLRVIRFGLMTLQEFAALDPRNVLTYDEHGEVIQMIASADYQPKLFNNNRKERAESLMDKSSENISCYRLLSINNSIKPYYMKSVESTKFSVNEHVWMTKVTLNTLNEYRNNRYGRFEFIKIIPSEMTITEAVDSRVDSAHPDEKVVLHNENVNLTTDTIGIDLPLSKAILIKPGFIFEIEMKQTPPENCVTGALLKSIVEDNTGLIVQFHNDPVIEKDPAARGLIGVLNFKRI